jgi:hypothetical protein
MYGRHSNRGVTPGLDSHESSTGFLNPSRESRKIGYGTCSVFGDHYLTGRQSRLRRVLLTTQSSRDSALRPPGARPPGRGQTGNIILKEGDARLGTPGFQGAHLSRTLGPQCGSDSLRVTLVQSEAYLWAHGPRPQIRDGGFSAVTSKRGLQSQMCGVKVSLR